MNKYEYLGTASKEIFCIDGINVLKYNWRTTGECVVVLHPETKKPYSFSVYEVSSNDRTVKFISGKFSYDGEQAFFICTK